MSGTSFLPLQPSKQIQAWLSEGCTCMGVSGNMDVDRQLSNLHSLAYGRVEKEEKKITQTICICCLKIMKNAMLCAQERIG